MENTWNRFATIVSKHRSSKDFERRTNSANLFSPLWNLDSEQKPKQAGFFVLLKGKDN